MSAFAAPYEIETDWVHIAYAENAAFTETYGFAGNQGMVNLEGIRMRPKGHASATLLIYMHPASTLQLLPVPRAAVQQGAHVLCAASRYAKNDTALILEKVLLDLGAYVRHAREVWGYRKVVLVGWSGGGSLALFYQAEAERPTITHTSAGDSVDLTRVGLSPVDAVIFQSAHISRAALLLDTIDPSLRDELDPDDRDIELDLYDARNPNQAPYDASFIARYRQAQRERVERITARTKATLAELKRRGTGEVERGFIVHRTLADPRFLDRAIDPNGRKPRWCYLGNPETVNSGPVGLARFSTLRSWLSQWSPADTNADGLACVARIAAPLLVIENGADDAVPQPHPGLVFAAATARDKTMHVIHGATHYYAGQPDKIAEATATVRVWLAERDLIES